MKQYVLALGVALSTCSTAAPAHASPSFPDRGRAGVVDAANVIPPQQERALNERIVGWNQTSGHQLVVATVPSLQGLDIKDFGYQLGRAWALGDSKRNDGVILLLAPSERKVRIEVGYGLEGVLTDGLTGTIIQSRVMPRLRAGETYEALRDGADRIMAAASVERVEAPSPSAAAPAPIWPFALLAALAAMGAMVIGVIIFVRRANARRAEAIARMEASRRDMRSTRHTLLSGADLSAVRSAFHSGSTVGPRQETKRPSSPPAPVRTSTASDTIGAGALGYGLGASSTPPSWDSGSSSSDWGGSSDSSSSSGGFDSGGGSFGGGGSDSSY